MKSSASMPRHIATVMLFLVQMVFSQSGGKIIGRVTDSQSGEPLIGANVLIDETQLGAATDRDGRFMILRVPPGRYRLVAQYIGYQRMVITDVQVLTDLTTEMDFQLESRVLTAEEEVIVIAERPLVRKDLTSVESRVEAEQIERMPAETLSDVLDMQAGVTRDGDGDIHIRGGRSSEVVYLVNGISITDDFNKDRALAIEISAVKELQVISGTFNAEFGNAMSGVVNIVTKSGSNTFHGIVQAEGGDYISSRDHLFYNIDHLSPLATNSLAATLSGPLVKDKLTFFATARRYSNDGWIYGLNRYSPQGRSVISDGDTLLLTGDSSTVPMNDWHRTSGQAALNWQILPSLSLKFDFIASTSTGRSYIHDSRFNPYGDGYSESQGRTLVANLTHQLSENTFHQFSLAEKYNSTSYSLYGDPDDPRYTHPDSALHPAYTFATAGTDLDFNERSTRSRIIKWNLTSQISWSHKIKTGLEYQSDNVGYEDYWLVPAKNENGLEIEPFQPAVEPSSQLSHNRYTRTPEKFAAYIQDKIEYESVVINVGLRFDLFDPHGKVPVDQEDPNIYQPFKLEHKYKDINNDGVIDLTEQVSDNEFTLDERRSFWYRDTDAKVQLSPRFGIAYPITDRGVIHFSYGIFRQIPEYSLLYGDDERKVSEGADVYGPFGDPDLAPQRTTMYELGLSQQLTDNMAINVTGFYRDIRDWISSGPAIPTKVASVSYVTYINRDFANVRGFTIMLDRRLSNRFSLGGDYTLQMVEGTNSAPEDEFWSQLNDEEPTRQLYLLNWDQRHTLNLNLYYGTDDFGVTLLSRYNSGQPYTPEILTGERSGRSIITGLVENSRRKSRHLTLDLRAFAKVKVLGSNVHLTAKVYNLLDARNPVWVFNDTGQADYTIRQDQVAGADEGYFVRPDYYSEPRQLILGIQFEY